jgi:hypothetical protein
MNFAFVDRVLEKVVGVSKMSSECQRGGAELTRVLIAKTYIRVSFTKALKAAMVDGFPEGCSSGTEDPFSSGGDQNSSSVSSGSSVSALKRKGLSSEWVHVIKTITMFTPRPTSSMNVHI